MEGEEKGNIRTISKKGSNTSTIFCAYVCVYVCAYGCAYCFLNGGGAFNGNIKDKSIRLIFIYLSDSLSLSLSLSFSLSFCLPLSLSILMEVSKELSKEALKEFPIELLKGILGRRV